MKTTGRTTLHGDHREYSAHVAILIDSNPFCPGHVAQSQLTLGRVILTEMFADRPLALTGALFAPQPTMGVFSPTKPWAIEG